MSNPTAKSALSVYLDQNIYSQILDDHPTDWRQGEMASILLAATKAGTAEVWAGPTIVIETVQTPDVVRRQALAKVILELIDTRRMWWGHEFESIQDFFLFLETYVKDAIRHRAFFDHHGITARQIWLGALGLIAACGAVNDDKVLSSLKRIKATNRLIHARFAANPANWIDQMLDAVEHLKTSADTFAAIDGMTLEQVEHEIGELTKQAGKMGKEQLKILNENRDRIARAYGAVEIGLMLRYIFTLPMEIELMFNVPAIVRDWSAMQKVIKCDSLPAHVLSAPFEKLAADPSVINEVLRLAIRAAARAGLMTGYLGYQVILRELQQCLNNKELPTAGLMFDADHAAALVRHHVFVCRDIKLTENLKTLAKKVSEYTQGKWCPVVVSTPKQLCKALGV